MICGVLRPNEAEIETFAQEFSTVLERADVLILDWVIYSFRNGEKALEIIKMLQDASSGEGRRARLILIYSGEPDLSQIVDSIRQKLKVDSDGDRYTIRSGPLRISVYAKDQTNVLDAHKSRCIKEERLPEIVILEFAAMAGGLVSNVALKSLGVLRANTHQLLSTFNGKLDGPYVTHRTLLLPEEASDHIVPLIVSEIQSILEDEHVGDLAGSANVAKWLKHQVKRGVKLSAKASDEKLYLKAMDLLLKKGVDKNAVAKMFATHQKFANVWLKNKDKDKAAKNIAENLTNALTLAAEQNQFSDQELAILMSIRSRYSAPAPVLHLGTIVLETSKGNSQYLLCVQPVCDSVRIDKSRAFPFLPLLDTSADGKCDFLIRNGKETHRLKLQTKPFHSKMITFNPAKREREIVARKEDAGYFFKATGRRARYQWIADLRPEHAQRVANEYAPQNFAGRSHGIGVAADHHRSHRLARFVVPLRYGGRPAFSGTGRWDKIDFAEIWLDAKCMPMAQRSLIGHPGEIVFCRRTHSIFICQFFHIFPDGIYPNINKISSNGHYDKLRVPRKLGDGKL